jgi:hypothetical protein
VALDGTVLRAKGGVWHKKDREAGVVPHTAIDTEADWTKSGWHGWVYGCKLCTWPSPSSVGFGFRFVLGSPPPTRRTTRWPRTRSRSCQNKPASCSETPTTQRAQRRAQACHSTERFLVGTKREGLTRTPMMASKSDASFTSCAAMADENLDEHFEAIFFEVHEQVPTRGLIDTQRFAHGAVLVYQLALLYRPERKLDVNRGPKPFLRAA